MILLLVVFVRGAPQSSAQDLSQKISLEKVGLPHVAYSPGFRLQIGGESVFLPLIEGFLPIQTALGDDCPNPRFGFRGLITSGWVARGVKDEDPFSPCHGRIRELAFIIFPSSPGKQVAKIANADIFENWKRLIASKEGPDHLSQVVLKAMGRLLKSDHPSNKIVAVAGGENEGFPFAAGRLAIMDSRGISREFYFSLAISLVGESWVATTAVADVKLAKVSVSEDTISLAKSIYILNRDYQGPEKRRLDPHGPFPNFR
jgi:hypothetical protein